MRFSIGNTRSNDHRRLIAAIYLFEKLYRSQVDRNELAIMTMLSAPREASAQVLTSNRRRGRRREQPENSG